MCEEKCAVEIWKSMGGKFFMFFLWKENYLFDSGVKMFNFITSIFGLDESIGEIINFNLHLVTK